MAILTPDRARTILTALNRKTPTIEETQAVFINAYGQIIVAKSEYQIKHVGRIINENTFEINGVTFLFSNVENTVDKCGLQRIDAPEMFVGKKDCGCVMAVCKDGFDNPNFVDLTLDALNEMRKSGLKVGKMPSDEALEAVSGDCRCNEIMLVEKT